MLSQACGLTQFILSFGSVFFLFACEQKERK
jgi:hypothetical protein